MKSKLYLKNHLLRTVLFGLFVLMLQSCEERDTDIIIPGTESKLVLSAFLNPNDSVIRVYVLQTNPTLGGPKESTVKSATVQISNANRTRIAYLTFKPEANAYLISIDDYPLEPGQTYLITATDNNRTASGKCTIPNTESIPFQYRIDSVGDGKDVIYHVTGTWKSAPGVTSYYRIDAEMSYMFYDESNGYYYFYSEELRPDQTEVFKGESSSSEFKISYTSSPIPKNHIKFCQVFLYSIDEPYYLFESSKQNNALNPFDKQTSYFSNVENGFGIIGSFNNMHEIPINLD